MQNIGNHKFCTILHVTSILESPHFMFGFVTHGVMKVKLTLNKILITRESHVTFIMYKQFIL